MPPTVYAFQPFLCVLRRPDQLDLGNRSRRHALQPCASRNGTYEGKEALRGVTMMGDKGHRERPKKDDHQQSNCPLGNWAIFVLQYFVLLTYVNSSQ